MKHLQELSLATHPLDRDACGCSSLGSERLGRLQWFLSDFAIDELGRGPRDRTGTGEISQPYLEAELQRSALMLYRIQTSS
jgi:hypothetical protein